MIAVISFNSPFTLSSSSTPFTPACKFELNAGAMLNARSLSTSTKLTSVDRSTSPACDFPYRRHAFNLDVDMAPRRVPSSVGLPETWTPEMDIFICYSDAVASDVSMKLTIHSLKKRFPELNNVSRLFGIWQQNTAVQNWMPSTGGAR